MMMLPRYRKFWDHVFARNDHGTRSIVRPVGACTAYSALVQFLNEFTNVYFPQLGDWGLGLAPYEVGGAALSALLVLRTNAGYDRWWEARRLWGSITNQSRNLAVVLLANGPDDPDWRRNAISWVAAFPHACRRSLRGQSALTDLIPLVGESEAQRLSETGHPPNAISLRLASLLREARDRELLDKFAYLQAETHRAALIDHLGGCERINKTPMPVAYQILIRRFIFLFLAVIPWALMPQVGWFTPLFMLLISYPILAIDRIGDDLQQPFSVRSINHLPLDDITTNIERNVFGLLEDPVELRLSETTSG